ncbi:MAG: hypothetical protein LAT76_11765 [Schleiferiaceae bacterium]|nr:hypothetical protein [Schleiferiaceae bacterium]
METKTIEIQKEEVDKLVFPGEEILKNPEDLQRRSTELHHAASLGNLEKHKVAIYFVDNEREKVVKTTIWAKTEQQVLLKGGRRIPINRITRVGMVG